jgi:tetratricopeptide (TPR) repeat protein
MGAIDLAAESALRVTERVPGDASAWARLGRLRLRLLKRDAAIEALERARLIEPSLEIQLDLALAYHLTGDVGAEVSAAEAATVIARDSPLAWSAYAHALARTDRLQECIAACEHALGLSNDPEVRDLLARTRAALPHELSSRTAA